MASPKSPSPSTPAQAECRQVVATLNELLECSPEAVKSVIDTNEFRKFSALVHSALQKDALAKLAEKLEDARAFAAKHNLPFIVDTLTEELEEARENWNSSNC